MNFVYETKRLILRVLDVTYAHAVCEFYENNRDTFEAFEPPRSPNFYTHEFHKASLIHEYGEMLQGRYLRLYLFDKQMPDTIIGSVCFNDFHGGCFQSCCLGYKMDHRFQRKGYMSECLRFCIPEIIAKEYPVHRIEALVLTDNLPSILLLEKLGFEKEGIARDYAKLNGIWQDHFRYSLLLYQ